MSVEMVKPPESVAVTVTVTFSLRSRLWSSLSFNSAFAVTSNRSSDTVKVWVSAMSSSRTVKSPTISPGVLSCTKLPLISIFVGASFTSMTLTLTKRTFVSPVELTVTEMVTRNWSVSSKLKANPPTSRSWLLTTTKLGSLLTSVILSREIVSEEVRLNAVKSPIKTPG